jgi:uncharacterized membrane protein
MGDAMLSGTLEGHMAAFHPSIAHFAIALLVVGVLFRIASLAGKPAFLAPAALTLLVLGTAAATLAVTSGTAAHGPVERIPGVREAVMTHEAWGERTRNVFWAILALEIVAVVLRRSPRGRVVLMASAALGLVGLLCVYEAGSHGGTLVYSYAGGVGTRSGNPVDVDRLLLAGLYQRGLAARKAGDAQQAARLFAQAGTQSPDNPEVKLMVAESLLRDRKDPTAALETLRSFEPDHDSRSLRIRHGLLTADALEAAGQRDGALAVLQTLVTEYPGVARLQQRLDASKRQAR